MNKRQEDPSQTGSTSPFPIIGIIGGGQLGKMIAQEAKKLSVSVALLDPDPGAPAVSLADYYIKGGFDDERAIQELANVADVITYELEAVSVAALKTVSTGGTPVFPDPGVLETLQDKLLQKQALVQAGLPTSDFVHCPSPSDSELVAFGFPLVQKARKGGYDGRGVHVCRNKDDAAQLLKTDSILEKCVDIATELAVIVARGADGEAVAYPVVEMTFHKDGNLLDTLISPARIAPEIEQKAKSLALETVRALNGVGVFGVELFLDKAGQLLINEVSPRPHNSGHYTIEACHTSQYEQVLRILMGWPLGSAHQLSPVVMVNILGEGQAGLTQVEGLERTLEIQGVTVHLYGKSKVSPRRKMGHVVVLDKDIESALEKASRVRESLRVFGG